MKPNYPFLSRPRAAWMTAGFAAMVLSSAAVFAAPGAHGPNGEHLDAPAQVAGTGASVPAFEAQSEAFELVGQLQGGGFSILVNRFATNEPVLNARVEVESGTLRAPAKFQADMGDYAIDDAAMLKALATPGEHAVVVTVVAGTDSDLLDGTLSVPGATLAAQGRSDDHGHAHGSSRTVWLALAVALLAALGWFLGRKPRVVGTSANGGEL